MQKHPQAVDATTTDRSRCGELLHLLQAVALVDRRLHGCSRGAGASADHLGTAFDACLCRFKQQLTVGTEPLQLPVLQWDVTQEQSHQVTQLGPVLSHGQSKKMAAARFDQQLVVAIGC